MQVYSYNQFPDASSSTFFPILKLERSENLMSCCCCCCSVVAVVAAVAVAQLLLLLLLLLLLSCCSVVANKNLNCEDMLCFQSHSKVPLTKASPVKPIMHVVSLSPPTQLDIRTLGKAWLCPGLLTWRPLYRWPPRNQHGLTLVWSEESQQDRRGETRASWKVMISNLKRRQGFSPLNIS